MPEGDSTWCDKHEIDHCSICKPSSVKKTGGVPQFSRGSKAVVDAKYDGSCNICQCSIYIGDPIVANGEGWAHEECV